MTARRRPGAALVFLAALALCAPPGVADAAGPRKKRKVAVLELRAGTEGARGIGLRMAALLEKGTSLDIIDATDARRIAGEHLDDEVARCKGDAACVAGVGERLGASEVILVGVSEFGDLIIALQRVKVQDRKVLARVAESLPKGTEPDDAALADYLRRLLPPEDFRRFGRIAVRADVDGAVVTVNGRRRGTTPIEPITVAAPATVEVRVAKPGYLDFTARLDVPPDATVLVRPALQRKGAGARVPWYQKWWVWAIAGGVVTGVAVGGVLLAEPAASSVPVTVEW